MSDKLTPREQVFVAEYATCLNIRSAAIDAGYSPRTADRSGWRLMQKPRVQAAVEKAISERIAQAKASVAPQRVTLTNQAATRERVIQELARIAFADPREVLTWIDGELYVKDSSELTADQASAIAEVSGQGPDMKVKFRRKETALNQLARHFGLLTEKPKPPYDLTLLSDEEYETFCSLARKIGNPNANLLESENSALPAPAPERNPAS